MRFFDIRYLYTKVYELLTGDFSAEGPIDYFNQTLLPILKIVAVAVVLLSLLGIIYSLLRTRDIWKVENKKYAFKIPDGVDQARNEKWEKVLALLNSENPSDWKQSIIEADIILDNMVGRMGYHGETLAEMLKGVERSDFTTIDNAWEAHKVRNRIAHEGSDFVLTQREAERVIKLFESVLKEFGYLG